MWLLGFGPSTQESPISSTASQLGRGAMKNSKNRPRAVAESGCGRWKTSSTGPRTSLSPSASAALRARQTDAVERGFRATGSKT